MARPMNDDDFERELLRRLDTFDDAFDDAANGKQDVTDAQDAAADADDAADLVAMSAALHSYRDRSLDWAEQRSAAMPSPLPPRATGWLAAPQWALGTVAFCGCVVGAALYTHHQAALVDQAAAVLPAAPTQQVLAADNDLLTSVDDALRDSVAPTEQQLGLEDTLAGDRASKRYAAAQRSN